ncbi:hypothetical protein [Rubellimicrobium arenae]|uniref:hypothetical protein n=1 Tax=Rubellimicrobium arenae TaxID=2817372 RepID=UPI001B306156|nr:hypothetical protein [Rubellimicrobium arenae]
MIRRPAALLALSIALNAAGLPAIAQTPEFGDDSSAWARDGECDDPRFAGPGMSSVTVQVDRMADATDCRTAFEAGQVRLVEDQGGPPATADAAEPGASPPALPAGPAPAPTGSAPGGKGSAATPAATAGVNFGNDSSEWANDGECDDRRFVGQGMAASISWASVGRDASDCRTLHDAGALRLWDWAEARAATQCAALDFGDDAGEYAHDGECDDLRFEGPGAAGALGEATVGHDASDCSQLCAFGVVALRDY